jgi:hypothetical protein
VHSDTESGANRLHMADQVFSAAIRSSVRVHSCTAVGRRLEDSLGNEQHGIRGLEPAIVPPGAHIGTRNAIDPTREHERLTSQDYLNTEVL